MATITFTPGDRFQCQKNGSPAFGLMLPSGEAFIVSGKGGRTGYSMKKEPMPTDATLPTDKPPFEVTFALDSVICALGLTS